jgi:YD repeat-containing protein
VTVNGNAATLGNANMFSLDLSLSPGTQTISIAATSGATTSTRSYTTSVSSTTVASVFAYDANGNTLYDGVQTYDYDGADRLIRVRNGSTVTEFVYDGLGRRVAEWDNGSLTRQWIWCGTELCEERNASNTVTKRFFPQGEQISGTAYFYSRDHLGSVREMTDSSGTVSVATQNRPVLAT